MQRKRSKYGVDLANPQTRTFEGIVFDSASEMKMYRDYLLPKQRAGEITSIERQVLYPLVEGFEHKGKKVRPITYIADFVVTYADGTEWVYDFKGQPDEVSRIKRKLFYWRYPEKNFAWIGYSKLDGGYVPYEQILAGRKARKAQKEKKNA